MQARCSSGECQTMQRFRERHRRQPSGDNGDAPGHDPFADRPGGGAVWPDRLSNVGAATAKTTTSASCRRIRWRWPTAMGERAPRRAADNRRRIAGIDRRKALYDREEAKRAPLASRLRRWNRLHVAASINLRSRQTCERTSLSRHGLKCTPSCRVRRSRRGHCLIARRDARQR